MSTQTNTLSQFRTRYGMQSLRVLRMLFDGYGNRHIAQVLHMSRTSVAAFAANFTRGVYDTWVKSFGWTPRFDSTARTVISRLRSGDSTDAIARSMKLDRGSVAAYKANYTRGTYDGLA